MMFGDSSLPYGTSDGLPLPLPPGNRCSQSVLSPRRGLPGHSCFALPVSRPPVRRDYRADISFVSIGEKSGTRHLGGLSVEFAWWARGELNPHGVSPQRILSPPRLPVPTLAQGDIPYRREGKRDGGDGRIRTAEWGFCRPLPCHLATSPRIQPWSGRWDLNPRPSPWQGDALPLSYSRILAHYNKGCLCGHLPGRPRREKNSARVLGFSRKIPRVADVTTRLPGFLIPRMVIHWCSASMTTPTPRA